MAAKPRPRRAHSLNEFRCSFLYLLGGDDIVTVGANQLPGLRCGVQWLQTFCSFLQKVIAPALLLARFAGQMLFDFQGNHRLLAAGQVPAREVEGDDKSQGRSPPLPGAKLRGNLQFQTGLVAVAPVDDFVLVQPDGF